MEIGLVNNAKNTAYSEKTIESLEKRYGKNFESYLNDFEKFSKDGVITQEELSNTKLNELRALTEITNIKNANGENIKNEVMYGGISGVSDEINDYLSQLQEKHLETKDPKYLFMQTEITLQYNAYQNGDDIDSMFVVGKNGQFNWSENKVTTLNNENVDNQKFVDTMLEIFTNKLKNTDGDLKEKYQDLVDNYQEMKQTFKEKEINSYKGTSFYA